MKKLLLVTLFVVCGLAAAVAQRPAEIRFDKQTHNIGTLRADSCVVTCVFSFTNVGEQPLVINQAFPSCGCTVPTYTHEPIQPGQKGEIKVTYNGTGANGGHFRKNVTVRTNGAVEMTRLYIEGDIE